MTTPPETNPQPRKSSADFINWRANYGGMTPEQIDYWTKIRKRSTDAISINGMMPFVYDPSYLVGAPTAENPAPGGAMPSPWDVQQRIRPGSNFPTSSGFNFTPEMKTDLLGALQGLVGKPGFDQLGPLLGLLGKG